MRRRLLEDLNSLILQKAKTHITADSQQPFTFDAIDFDSLIANTDETLWSAVTILTRTASECTKSDRNPESDMYETRSRNIKRFFCLCALMFCANNRCHMPLHSLIADMVDGLGGSADLIRILNRLGICSSIDTLERRIQYVSNLREETGVECECHETAATFVSANNIDFVHSFSQVYCGKPERSWHGTTVQIVQPNSSLHEHTESTVTSPQCSLGEKRTSRKNPTPNPKVRRRARTARELDPLQGEATMINKTLPLQSSRSLSLHGVTLRDFKLTECQQDTLVSLQKQLTTYILLKHKNSLHTAEENLISMQDFMRLTNPCRVERSAITYLSVLDAKADSKDTIMIVLQDVHQRYIEEKKKEWVLIEGDAKVYELIQSLKCEYGEELKWVLPYPGDWHLLKNYQRVLMKVYYDAGFKSLAEAAGYPCAAIQSCSQFKRTHHFIMEAWEALYRVMIETHLSSTPLSPLLQQVVQSLLDNRHKGDDLTNLLDKLETVMNDTNFHLHVHDFLNSRASNDSTWKFWVQFVLVDGYAYVALYLAIRSGNWELRNASIKQMTPLFTSYDHFTYRKLIAQHLADMITFPEAVLSELEQGSFVVSILGREWHSVAMDEAHEMLINKACKTSIVHPNGDYIARIAKYLPYRAKCLENLKRQLSFGDELVSPIHDLYTVKPCDKKSEANIQLQTNVVKAKKLFEITIDDRGLINPFTNKHASPDQLHDLLNFREIGNSEFNKFIEYYILHQASIKLPGRKKQLLTFSNKKPSKRHTNQLERDRRIVQKCIHKKIKWSKQTGHPIDIGEQYIPIPLAIATNDGQPRKGQKSNTTKCLMTRYQESSPPVLLNSLPSGWVPESCFLEGMFLLHTVPLTTQKTFNDYAKFLVERFIIPRFKQGAREVHVIFDNAERLPQTPKMHERSRRDKSARIVTGHTCDTITSQKSVPTTKWQEGLINCRTCKRFLVLFLSNAFLKCTPPYLKEGQRFVVAGGFEGNLQDTAWHVDCKGQPNPEPMLTTNAEETDTRVWRHVNQSTTSQCLVVSPDTDVYMIGLPLNHGNRDIIVQINPHNKRELQYIHLTALVEVLNNDPDIAEIHHKDKIQKMIQTLYIASGCDYISFFKGIGKATFIKCFFAHANFISGNPDYPGTLAHTS